MWSAKRAVESVLGRELTTDEYCTKSGSVYFMAGIDETHQAGVSNAVGKQQAENNSARATESKRPVLKAEER